MHVRPEFCKKALFEDLDKFFHIGGGFPHGLGRDRGHTQALGLYLRFGGRLCTVATSLCLWRWRGSRGERGLDSLLQQRQFIVGQKVKVGLALAGGQTSIIVQTTLNEQINQPVRHINDVLDGLLGDVVAV